MRYAFGELGYYELNPFPGCNQLVVSNHSCIFPEHRGKGHGSDLSKAKIDQAKSEGFDYMIATVRQDNDPQMKIMRENGWTELDSFENSESSNRVVIFGKQLRATI